MARHHHVAAHAALGVAVRAGAGVLAGGVRMQAHGVRRAGHRMHALDARVHVGHHLVHARQHNHLLRPEQKARQAVRIAIDVDQLAVERDGVRAHKERVGREMLLVDGARLFRGLRHRTVEHAVVARLERGLHASFLERLGAAPGHGAAFRDQLADQLDGFSRGFAIMPLHAVAFELLDDGRRRCGECVGARIAHGIPLLDWFANQPVARDRYGRPVG